MSIISGFSRLENSFENLRALVLLDMTFGLEDLISKIPQHRLVLFVKKIISWLEQGLLEESFITALAARILNVVLPFIQDVYGSHWSSVFDLINRVWSNWLEGTPPDMRLPAIHATIKLFTVLGKIHGANDDADDAWSSNVDGLNKGLVRLLTLAPSKWKSHPYPWRCS